MPEFPGNSKNPQPVQPEKNIESVVVNEVSLRKKPLGRRLREIFIGGDSKSVVHYVFADVLVPQLKDMINEAASQGFERLIFGDSRPTRRFGNRPSGPGGPVNYNRIAMRGNNPIGRANAEVSPRMAQPKTQDLDDILFATRLEADEVLGRMYDLLESYNNVSVADLYQLVGLSGSYVDNKWGWVDLAGSNIQRTRNGYVLNLPSTVALD